MDILAVPRHLATFVLRLIGLVFLSVYGIGLGFWERSVRPLVSPALSLADSVPAEEVTVPGILERVIKVALMCVLLWWRVVTAVWETLSRPFQGIIQAVKKFFWQLEYEVNMKTK